MYAAPGVGLAAPQVNVSKRLFVMDVHDDEPRAGRSSSIRSSKRSDEEVELREGCLSVPGMVGEIVRYKRAAVTGLDRHGQKIRIEGEGLFAQCLQHEMDHLDGMLYIDRAKNLRPAATRRGEEETARGVKTLFFGTSAFAVPSLRVVAARTQLRRRRDAARSSGRARPASDAESRESAPRSNSALPRLRAAALRAFAAEIARRALRSASSLASYGRILPQRAARSAAVGRAQRPSRRCCRSIAARRRFKPRSQRRPRDRREHHADGCRDWIPAISCSSERVAIEPGRNLRRAARPSRRRSARSCSRDALDLAERGELAARPQAASASLTRPLREGRSYARSGAGRRSASSIAFAPIRRSRPRARHSTARPSRSCARTSTPEGDARHRRADRAESRQDERRGVSTARRRRTSVNARELALSVVRDVFPASGVARRPNVYAQASFDYRARRTQLSDATARSPPSWPTARSRCAARSTGISSRSSASAARRCRPSIREILRLAIYELVYTRADEHATVFEFVNLAKRHAHRGLANLVNAVLRRFFAQRPPEPQRERFDERATSISATRYSLPTWLVRQWREVFGDAASKRSARR